MSHISDFSRINQPGIPERKPDSSGGQQSSQSFRQKLEQADAATLHATARQLMTALDRASMSALFSDASGPRFKQAQLSTDLFMAMRKLDDALPRPATAQAQQEAARVPLLAAGNAESFRPLIDQAATKTGLDPKLIEAVIRAESDFDPQSLSPVGAQGLMQLMPETAADLGVADPFDPVQNIDGGSRYLKQLMDRYDGDVGKALAAYNWGMGNLDRHPDRMPTETINYVAKITGWLNNA